MAMIYKHPNVNKLVAHMAKPEVWEHTRQLGRRAGTLLADHRDQGYTQIEMEMGRVDGYVYLFDRELMRSMSIETGTSTSRAINVLREAAGEALIEGGD